jgi:uncharacterized integral membrane protein (TIGR00698 family)
MRLLPGVGACLIAVFLATLLSGVFTTLPTLTLAVVIGIVAGQLPGFRSLLDGVLEPGIRFASVTVMRVGIVLLGLQLSLGDIGALGLPAVVGVVVLVVASFFVTWWIGRMLRLPGREPLLVAAGFSICGASAIGAMASATRSGPREQATPIALVTLCGTLAIAVLPALRAPLGLSVEQFGFWVGAGVHDVGQVVATAQTAGAAALAIAVVVKLTRVLMLAPLVSIAALMTRREESRTAADPVVTAPLRAPAPENGEGASEPIGSLPVVPLFVVGFIAAALVNSFVVVPGPVMIAAEQVQLVALTAALFALGTSVRVLELLRTGWRALVVGLGSWAFIAIGALALARGVGGG